MYMLTIVYIYVLLFMNVCLFLLLVKMVTGLYKICSLVYNVHKVSFISIPAYIIEMGYVKSHYGYRFVAVYL